MKKYVQGEAKSICYCSHLGDGLYGDHEDRYSVGHSRCKVSGCKCIQFTWKKWTPEYEEFLKSQKKEKK